MIVRRTTNWNRSTKHKMQVFLCYMSHTQRIHHALFKGDALGVFHSNLKVCDTHAFYSDRLSFPLADLELLNQLRSL